MSLTSTVVLSVAPAGTATGSGASPPRCQWVFLKFVVSALQHQMPAYTISLGDPAAVPAYTGTISNIKYCRTGSHCHLKVQLLGYQ